MKEVEHAPCNRHSAAEAEEMLTSCAANKATVEINRVVFSQMRGSESANTCDNTEHDAADWSMSEICPRASATTSRSPLPTKINDEGYILGMR
eukprot:6209682-Pleurochrysis_carterae.AAC.4